MSLNVARVITVILIIATPLVWIAWDVYVYRTFGNTPTESRVLAGWADKWPWFRYVVTMAVFGIVGHTLWSQHLGSK